MNKIPEYTQNSLLANAVPQSFPNELNKDIDESCKAGKHCKDK